MKLTNFFIVFLLLTFSLSCTKDVPEIENREAILRVADSVDVERIMPMIEQLTTLHLNDTPIDNTGFPSKDNYPTEHLTRDAAVGFVANAFRDLGYQVDTLVQSNGQTTTYNVVAEYKGNLIPDEVVLIGGHLDAFYGGSDDNSSAITALLEIARVVKKFTFKRTIRFVAFDLEEFGSLGSTRYVEAGYADDVTSAVIMDLLGFSSEETGSQDNIMGIKVPDVGNYIFTIANEQSSTLAQKVVNLAHTSKIAKTYGIIAPGDGSAFLASVFMRSDNALFWHKKIPTLFFTDGANFRNPNYHKESDLPETLNKSFLTNNIRLIAATVSLMAEVQ